MCCAGSELCKNVCSEPSFECRPGKFAREIYNFSLQNGKKTQEYLPAYAQKRIKKPVKSEIASYDCIIIFSLSTGIFSISHRKRPSCFSVGWFALQDSSINQRRSKQLSPVGEIGLAPLIKLKNQA